MQAIGGETNIRRGKMGLTFKRDDFPKGFKFGTATSSYQIEGHQFGNAGSTHWDTFAATPGNVVRGENGDIACGHYNRWEEDLDLIKAGGFDSYRFSTSWARVLPDGTGQVNAEGLDFYDRLVDGMLERGIDPYLTLYHWEMPSALAVKGGWQNPDVASWFADYAVVMMERLGDRVKATATINEPWCVAWLSHFMGLHAPGLRDIKATAHAMHHVLLAHGKSIQAMRGLGMKNLGLVTNFEWAMPGDDTEEAKKLTDLYTSIYNRWFVQAAFTKTYPEDVLEGLGPHMPKGWENDMETIGTPVDFLGVNYYTCRRVVEDKNSQWPHIADKPGNLKKTAMDWEIMPDGLYNILTWLKENYTGDTPIYITENGLASYDTVENGSVYDPDRIEYLDQHMHAVKRAIGDGVPVEGYFAWSLMDNFEWALGYDKRFGMVHVDFDSLERTPKASYHELAKVLTSK